MDAHDVKRAEREAEDAEANAADALDYAEWAVDQAELAVLDAIDAPHLGRRAGRRVIMIISAWAAHVLAVR